MAELSASRVHLPLPPGMATGCPKSHCIRGPASLPSSASSSPQDLRTSDLEPGPQWPYLTPTWVRAGLREFARCAVWPGYHVAVVAVVAQGPALGTQLAELGPPSRSVHSCEVDKCVNYRLKNIGPRQAYGLWIFFCSILNNLGY